MGAFFSVEVAELDRLLQQLKQGEDDMRAALGAMRETGPKTTGTRELDRACDEFPEYVGMLAQLSETGSY
jgi:hypothetical protein